MLKFAGTILRNLVHKPATKRYPTEAPVYFDRTRGHIEIDIDSCIFCGICSRRCPSNAITVKKDETSWGIERMRCIQCNSCVEVCPKKCLTMRNTYTDPSTEPVKDVFARARVPAGTDDHKEG